ncbi:hypothetical protein ACFT5B_03825 [Luteimicrobium sp. NPDC057192]|uniref:hypothetical protein n=1 Tax=Luteimicrobium sp. NPDC057192 TaxID=3346042 RepID=UPI00362F955C
MTTTYQLGSSPMLDAFRKIAGTVTETVSSALSNVPFSLTEPGPTALRAAATAWTPVPSAVQAIDATLTRVGKDVFNTATDRNLSAEGKAAQLQVVVSAARTTIEVETNTILTAATKVQSTLLAVAYPARPNPQDAAQEARLAGIKADLRMVLDPTGPGELGARAGALLTRAIADKDTLTTWLLASSRWPEDYFVSRGADVALAGWPSTVSSNLNGIDDDLRDVRRAYAAVTQPQRGLPALEVVLRTAVPAVLADVTNGATRS